MSGSPTVSVVLIFRDDERFLPEAIASVFAQTYGDWELLLVDDGSTDGSPAVARRWAADHPTKVRYLEHEGHRNLGISATRNLGWREATGTYVALLDSDDVWEPTKLEVQVGILEEHPDAGLVVGASRWWWSWAGDGGEYHDRVVEVGAPSDQIHHPPTLLPTLYPFGRGAAPCPSSCIARRELLELVGGFEERFRTMYEDQAFLVKAYHRTSVWVSGQCLDRYRKHAGQIMTSTSREEYHRVRQEFLRWYEGWLRDEGIHGDAVWSALRRAWWPYRHPRLAAVRRRVGRTRAELRGRWRTPRQPSGMTQR
jgi:glycosyltransferase involved in cell wall biosynthesis